MRLFNTSTRVVLLTSILSANASPLRVVQNSGLEVRSGTDFHDSFVKLPVTGNPERRHSGIGKGNAFPARSTKLVKDDEPPLIVGRSFEKEVDKRTSSVLEERKDGAKLKAPPYNPPIEFKKRENNLEPDQASVFERVKRVLKAPPPGEPIEVKRRSNTLKDQLLAKRKNQGQSLKAPPPDQTITIKRGSDIPGFGDIPDGTNPGGAHKRAPQLKGPELPNLIDDIPDGTNPGGLTKRVSP
ncbi:hypothetical protein HYALB_00014096 [Hymenoscyphus albidus]|uniref:Uncharacterized protein n=1 Tax=Hymenoscyphus albidus TaxID=595503 RepID=A0A9N9LXJ6_9HELO|nr:hypothetical protein HYALB_00007395 [Hymenoscyphus albidus]CAG8981900.1 hypothetical protein HYALB_00013860 [Hymenoscyphus albidus]CAG8982939.1 hypothetical protein HYALB_00014096 [Hymenoscyphus albidus]